MTQLQNQPHTQSSNQPVYATQYRIYLEDSDAGGIVYHANHLKLFERCRRDWLRELGMTSYFYQAHSAEAASHVTHHSDSGKADIQFVVSQANIRYLRPILLDSEVTVVIEAADCKSASLQLEQRIYDSHQQLLSQAEISIVCVATSKDEKGQTQVRPTRLPKAFVQLLQLAR
ncbi:thioesterase family protein [Moraxella osloensis]|uniref:thioesterase family protein n=1 Tax=Faucicola osloensis TaxID=34062 RepID=UPI0020069629|nr:thioesterase family protein [Moraxella osloensis]MCK6157485.1 thioesterase family protein [Moraxella osloensis]